MGLDIATTLGSQLLVVVGHPTHLPLMLFRLPIEHILCCKFLYDYGRVIYDQQ